MQCPTYGIRLGNYYKKSPCQLYTLVAISLVPRLPGMRICIICVFSHMSGIMKGIKKKDNCVGVINYKPTPTHTIVLWISLHACTTSMFAFQSMGAWERS